MHRTTIHVHMTHQHYLFIYLSIKVFLWQLEGLISKIHAYQGCQRTAWPVWPGHGQQPDLAVTNKGRAGP